jgi:nitroreductase
MPGVPLTPDELLTTTRSVRKRLDLTRPVPLDLVQECLEIALQAPNGGMREGWHWIVVTDPQVSPLARPHRTGSLGRVEVTDRDDMPGLHDPRAEARRRSVACTRPPGSGDAVSRAVARD